MPVQLQCCCLQVLHNCWGGCMYIRTSVHRPCRLVCPFCPLRCLPSGSPSSATRSRSPWPGLSTRRVGPSQKWCTTPSRWPTPSRSTWRHSRTSSCAPAGELRAVWEEGRGWWPVCLAGDVCPRVHAYTVRPPPLLFNPMQEAAQPALAGDGGGHRGRRHGRAVPAHGPGAGRGVLQACGCTLVLHTWVHMYVGTTVPSHASLLPSSSSSFLQEMYQILVRWLWHDTECELIPAQVAEVSKGGGWGGARGQAAACCVRASQSPSLTLSLLARRTHARFAERPGPAGRPPHPAGLQRATRGVGGGRQERPHHSLHDPGEPQRGCWLAELHMAPPLQMYTCTPVHIAVLSLHLPPHASQLNRGPPKDYPGDPPTNEEKLTLAMLWWPLPDDEAAKAARAAQLAAAKAAAKRVSDAGAWAGRGTAARWLQRGTAGLWRMYVCTAVHALMLPSMLLSVLCRCWRPARLRERPRPRTMTS